MSGTCSGRSIFQSLDGGWGVVNRIKAHAKVTLCRVSPPCGGVLCNRITRGVRTGFRRRKWLVAVNDGHSNANVFFFRRTSIHLVKFGTNIILGDVDN